MPIEISSQEDIAGILIEHLLWFYNYWMRFSCKDFGYGALDYELNYLEGKAVFQGRALGRLIDIINGNGIMGSRNVTENVTGQFSRAVYWARPESRVDSTFVSDDDSPTEELDSLNRYMSQQSQKMSDKFQAIVLAFKPLILNESYNLDHLVNYPEIRIYGGISLNDLTFECKKYLVDTLNITESKS